MNYPSGKLSRYMDRVVYIEKRLLYEDVFDWYEGCWGYRDSCCCSKVLFVKYEYLKVNNKKEVSRIAEFVGRHLSNEQLETV